MRLPARKNPKLEAALRRPGAPVELADGSAVGGVPHHVAAFYAAARGQTISLAVWALGMWTATRCNFRLSTYWALIAAIRKGVHDTLRRDLPFIDIDSGREVYFSWIWHVAYIICPKASASRAHMLYAIAAHADRFVFVGLRAIRNCAHPAFESDREFVTADQLSAEHLSAATARNRAIAIMRIYHRIVDNAEQDLYYIRLANRVDPTYYGSYLCFARSLAISPEICGSEPSVIQFGSRSLTVWGLWLEALQLCDTPESRADSLREITIHLNRLTISDDYRGYHLRILSMTFMSGNIRMVSTGEAAMPFIGYILQIQQHHADGRKICSGSSMCDALGREHLWTWMRHRIFDMFTHAHDLFETLMCGLQRLEDGGSCAPSHTAMWEDALESHWTLADSCPTP